MWNFKVIFNNSLSFKLLNQTVEIIPNVFKL